MVNETFPIGLNSKTDPGIPGLNLKNPEILELEICPEIVLTRCDI